ncbi:hypothetical protein CBS101457_005079 [Exobasidium rhododendri]|nr:hypothetical protein CBS101457_005079 [Exobasidium rhododendri]
MTMVSSNERIPSIIPAVRDSGKEHAERTYRKVVICLDGTGDEFDADNSNVVKFFAALKKDDPTQLCYYQSGVGTYSNSYGGSLKGGVSAALDMAVGASLGTHVREAYSFLMQNYREGDKICLYGFSRGAYTARALAGMLHKVGLLPAHNQAQITFAYKWYKDDTANGWKMSTDFKRTFSIDVSVYFLGCWDTVASVGIIPRILPFAKTNNAAVTHFRHALALDERRAKFKANHWYQRGPKAVGSARHTQEAAMDSSIPEKTSSEREQETRKIREGLEKAFDSHEKRQSWSRNAMAPLNRPSLGFFGEIPEAVNAADLGNSEIKPADDDDTLAGSRRTSSRKLASHALSHSESLPTSLGEERKDRAKKEDKPVKVQVQVQKEEDKREKMQDELMKQFLQADAREYGWHEKETDVLEVWFLGCHADCGGGAVPNETRHMLSRIPLRWMLRQTFACDTGLLFHSDVLAEHGLDVETMWPILTKREAPCVGPAPTALDRYAKSDLPSLAARRLSYRRRSLAGPMAAATEEVAPPIIDESFSCNSYKENDPECLPEHYEDYFDSLSPINDQLKVSWPWWILEFLPIKYRVKTEDGTTWKKKVGPNRGRYRTIREIRPNLHWTVRERERVQAYRIKCPTDSNVQWKLAY